MNEPTQRASIGRWTKLALILFGVVFVLLVSLWFAARAYLHGPEFQRFVSARLSETLRAEVECAALRFDGFSVMCEGVTARGYEGSPFAEARLDKVRARFSLRRVFSRAWEIEHLDAVRLELNLDGTRLAAPMVPKLQTRNSEPGSGWLPNRLEPGAANVRELVITWGDLPSTAGALRGVAVQATPAEGGWIFEGRGGELIAAGMPPLDVSALRLRQRGTQLFVNEAKFSGRAGGSASATGEIDFARALDLRGQVEGIDLAPFLAGDWRLRLHGKMSGDFRVQAALPMVAQPTVSGSLRFDDARIDTLPVLDQIAVFTRTQSLRQLTLSRATCDFRSEPGRLEVTKLVAESAGRLRVEGGFFVVDRQLDGMFEVGVLPSMIAWLPGAQERVFTATRDGYVWAPMRLGGPVDAPTEDLSARLVTAAAEVVVERVEGAAQDVIKRGKDAAKSALDLLMPLLR
ncbi:MAG: hypothetical protein ABMA13_00435 [Chthoniobacteraceae bacterium]